MTDAERLELDRPRTFGAFFRDSLRVWFRNLRTFLTIGVAVVVPAELIISGVGLGRLGADYDEDAPLAAELMPQAAQTLVTMPLIVAMTVHVLLALSEGERPPARRAIQAGLDAFATVFVPVIAAVACEAVAVLTLVLPLALAVESALVPTIVVPLYLAVRWYVVPQAVVAGGARRLDALRASWRLTRGSGWRVFGLVVAAYLAFSWTATLVASPLIAAARSADAGAFLVAFNALWQALAIPLIAIFSTLLYFDLRARSRAGG